jgi:hypothetical protein
MLREILDPVSTLTYDQFETIIDITMILYLFYQFHLPLLIGCCVSTLSGVSAMEYYPYGVTEFTETFFVLLPTIANTLLAIDRCRSVIHPTL